MVDKFAALIAVELSEGEGKGGVEVLEGVEGPAAGLVGEGIQAYPAGSGLPAAVSG
jgi:hypothetical protein